MADAPYVLIVEAPYYTHIAERLLAGATAVLDAAGASYERIAVPGAFEVPAAIRFAAAAAELGGTAARYDGYIALGCVIRGETTHYDYVCQESARGLQDLALQHQLAIGYGILTVENEAQALARTQIGARDKGGEATEACLAMIAHKQRFGLLKR
jgi:6,7-dimethyl-8-ribityllumazine synthase